MQDFILQRQIHELVREVREAAGLTQEQVAERLGVARKNVTVAESDESGRYQRIQKRILHELGGYTVAGPYWKVEKH